MLKHDLQKELWCPPPPLPEGTHDNIKMTLDVPAMLPGRRYFYRPHHPRVQPDTSFA